MNKLIQNTVIVYLALVMLVRMMAMPISLLDYSVNKDFIAATLCENKDRPEMHCSGQCFLNKQLNKANESQESKSQRSTVKVSSVDFFERSTSPVFGCEREERAPYSFFHPAYPSPIYCGNIFHPPIA